MQKNKQTDFKQVIQNDLILPHDVQVERLVLGQMDYTNNTELNAQLTAWAANEILQQLPAICTKHGKQYTDEQLQEWVQRQLSTDKVNILKTTFTMFGVPLHSDTVKHLLNRANYQLKNNGEMDVVQVKATAQGRSKANNYQSPFK